MCKEKKALQHAIAWGIQHVYNTNKEAKDILDNKDLTEEQRIEALRGPAGPDYRLLNLILLLKPMREVAEKEFPEQKDFFTWFDERWEYVQEKEFVKGECGCKGCLPEQAEQDKEKEA